MLKDRIPSKKPTRQPTQPTTTSAPPASTVITANMTLSILSNMEDETRMAAPIVNESTPSRKRKTQTIFKFKARKPKIFIACTN